MTTPERVARDFLRFVDQHEAEEAERARSFWRRYWILLMTSPIGIALCCVSVWAFYATGAGDWPLWGQAALILGNLALVALIVRNTWRAVQHGRSYREASESIKRSQASIREKMTKVLEDEQQ